MPKTVGDFQITEKIGKGSFAEVYMGISLIDNKQYAVKIIAKELLLSEPKLAQGLESEIKIMQEFVHPHIVHLHRHFNTENNVYLVLDYCAGGDLSRFIRKKGRIPEPVALRFLDPIADGLAFLKDRNFIHRDLKPANVLLSDSSENATLKLADFGFARYLLEAALAQTRCGTPLYMAPEILEGKDYDSKADMWSLGCILFEMLTQKPPFRGTSEMDLLRNIRTKELRLPDDVVVSKGVVELLAKLLERDATRRANVDQVRIVLAHLRNEPVAQAYAPSGFVPLVPVASSPPRAPPAKPSHSSVMPPPQPLPMTPLQVPQHTPPALRHTPREEPHMTIRPIMPPPPEEDDFVVIDPHARKGAFRVTPQADHTSGPMADQAEQAHRDEEAHLASEHLAQTCSTFCELFNALVYTADRLIARSPQSQQFFMQCKTEPGPTVTFYSPDEGLRECLRACALYLHALEIFKTFTRVLQPHNGVTPTDLIKKDLPTVVDQLLDRAERGQCLAGALAALQPAHRRASVPRPEQVMLEEAMELEGEASVRMQLGDPSMGRYLFLYASALMRGIAFTVPETEHRGLRAEVDRLERSASDCSEAMERLGIQAKSFVTA